MLQPTNKQTRNREKERERGLAREDFFHPKPQQKSISRLPPGPSVSTGADSAA